MAGKRGLESYNIRDFQSKLQAYIYCTIQINTL